VLTLALSGKRPQKYSIPSDEEAASLSEHSCVRWFSVHETKSVSDLWLSINDQCQVQEHACSLASVYVLLASASETFLAGNASPARRLFGC